MKSHVRSGMLAAFALTFFLSLCSCGKRGGNLAASPPGGTAEKTGSVGVAPAKDDGPAPVNPALAAYSEGLDDLSTGKWAEAADAFARAREASPGDFRFGLAHAVAVGLREHFQDAVAELARLPRTDPNNREPVLWTYVFEKMGNFATAEHRGGGSRLSGPNPPIVPNEPVSMPGHMVQGRGDYPTDFASFVYYEVAQNGYGVPRQHGQTPDPAKTQALRVEAGRWFAARFEASPDLAAAHVQRGEQLNQSREFAASLNELGYARIPYPMDASITYFTGSDWLGLGRPLTARRELTFAATRRTDLAAAYANRAVAAAEAGDGARAGADIETARRLGAANLNRYEDTVKKALAANAADADPMTLLANLEKAARSGAAFETLVEQAGALHRAAGPHRKRYDEIYQDRLRQLEEAVRAKPKSADALADLAKHLTDESNQDHRSEAVEPRRPLTSYRERPDEKAELERALAVCDEGLRLNPKHVRAAMQKAMALSRLGQNADAEKLVDYVLGFAPKDPDALRMRAEYWAERASSLSLQAAGLRQGRTTTDSHTEYRSDGVYTVTVTTYYPPTARDLARAEELDAEAKELYKKAAQAIDAALAVTRGTLAGLLLEGDVQFGRGQADAAEATFKKAVRENPQSIEAQERLVDLYLKMGRPDQADEQRAVMTNLFQTSAGWALKPVWGKIARNDFAGALALLETARKLDPEDARTPAYRGAVLLGEGKTAEARAEFTLALAMEVARLRMDEPSSWTGAVPAHDPQEFGLAMKLRELLAAGAKPEEALALYEANEAFAKLVGPGGRAVQMFSAMLPEAGAQQFPVPAPVNMATLLADSYVSAGKCLQALGRNDQAAARFLAATAYGPKMGIPLVIGAKGNTEESNFAGLATGQITVAYIELAKLAIARKDFAKASQYLSAGTKLHIPPELMSEVNRIQLQIAQGSSEQAQQEIQQKQQLLQQQRDQEMKRELERMQQQQQRRQGGTPQ